MQRQFSSRISAQFFLAIVQTLNSFGVTESVAKSFADKYIQRHSPIDDVSSSSQYVTRAVDAFWDSQQSSCGSAGGGSAGGGSASCGSAGGSYVGHASAKGRYQCNVCDYSSGIDQDLYEHQLLKHPDIYDSGTDVACSKVPFSFKEERFIGPKFEDFTPFKREELDTQLEQLAQESPTRLLQRVIPAPILEINSSNCGLFRGIQGINNSCLYDVFFMIMGFSSVFDSIFTEEALNHSLLLRIILFEVVIPLRTRMYVNRNAIAMIRTLLYQATKNRQYLNDVFDFTEFLMGLEKCINLTCVSNFPINDFIESSLVFPIVVTEGLMRESLQNVFDCNILSMRINLESFNASAFFLRIRSHDISVPSYVLPQPTLRINKSQYKLTGIICIAKAHYVIIMRVMNKWFFSDSMRYFEVGNCIPMMTLIPHFDDYINSGCDERFLTVKSDTLPNEGERDRYDDRVRSQCYALFYTKMSDESSSPAQCARRVILPEILCEDDCTSEFSEFFSNHLHQQQQEPDKMETIHLSCRENLFETHPNAFLNICDKALSSFSVLPKSLEISGFSIPKELILRGVENLIGSFPFRSTGSRFRVLSTTFADGNIVSHEGKIEELSHSLVKKNFYDRILEVGAYHAIISVVIVQLPK
jgi:hypothetical protein